MKPTTNHILVSSFSSLHILFYSVWSMIFSPPYPDVLLWLCLTDIIMNIMEHHIWYQRALSSFHYTCHDSQMTRKESNNQPTFDSLQMFKSLRLRGCVLPQHASIILPDTVTLMNYLWLSMVKIHWTDIRRNVAKSHQPPL